MPKSCWLRIEAERRQTFWTQYSAITFCGKQHKTLKYAISLIPLKVQRIPWFAMQIISDLFYFFGNHNFTNIWCFWCVQMNVLGIDLQETNFLISMGVPIPSAFELTWACTLNFIFVCAFTSGRMNRWLLKAVSKIFEGLEKQSETRHGSWAVWSRSALSSFPCVSWKHAEHQRMLNRRSKMKRASKENWNATRNIGKVRKSRVVLCFVEVVGSFSHRVQVEGEGW